MIIYLIEKNKFNKEKIEFVFLGRFIGEYGNKIKVKLSKLKAFGFIISTFTQYIPARSYEREILSADYILTAFKPNYITPAGVNEFIGVTKETGVPYIAFTYQKKAIIPSYYSIPDLIAENVFQYDGIEDLSTFLSKSLLNKKTDTQLFGSSIVKKNKILGNLRNIFELNI